MPEAQLLDPIRILHGSDQPVVEDAVLIRDNHLIAFGAKARIQAQQLGLPPNQPANNYSPPVL